MSSRKVTRILDAFNGAQRSAVEAADRIGRVEGHIELSSRFSDDEARFSGRDNGRGMKAEKLERMFDPGYPTKGRGVGLGLGLSMVLRFVEERDGRIEAESEVGVGTTFTVVLRRPRVEGPQ